jgi:transmembrane sensor
MKRYHKPEDLEARADQVWRRLGEPNRRRRRVVRWSYGTVPVAAAAALALVWMLAPEEPSSLTMRDATPLARHLHGSADLALSDGTRLVLEDEARLEVLQNEPLAIEIAHRAGTVRYQVARRGRQWRIGAGSAVVEVLGTEFTIARGQGAVAVAVHEGSVLIRSASLADGVVQLRADEEVRVQIAHEPNPSELVPTVTLDEVASVGPAEVAEPDREPEIASPASRGTSREMRRGPAARVPASSTSLLAQADEARHAGDFETSVALLSRVSARGDEHSAVAAFTLGRLLAETQPGAAAGHFERALELGIGEPLRRHAYERRIEALDAAGVDATSARTALRAAYPDLSGTTP